MKWLVLLASINEVEDVDEDAIESLTELACLRHSEVF
jgi:hypothetical protein